MNKRKLVKCAWIISSVGADAHAVKPANWNTDKLGHLLNRNTFSFD